MKKVLIFADYFLPGFKAGGPIRSISSICNAMCDRCDIYLVTRDRDMGSKYPFDYVVTDQWSKIYGINVMYKKNSDVNYSFIKAVIAEVKPHTVHLNSLMSVRFSFLPLLTLWYLGDAVNNVLLSPRGELSQGALSIKKSKKRVYLTLFKILGLNKFVDWIASSDNEKNDIFLQFDSKNMVIHRIDNLPNVNPWLVEIQRKTLKETNSLKMVFLARISKMKNLLFLLNVLKHVKSNVSLTVYGPIEDETYFNDCKEVIETLPLNVKFEYLGTVSAENVYSTLREYDLFVLPTLGENFGQAIWEALASSVPVLISDQTPWKKLSDTEIGWDISLNQTDKFIEVIEHVCEMNESQHQKMRNCSRQFALEYVKNNDAAKLLHSLYVT